VRLQKLLSCLLVKSQALQQTHNKADAIGAGEFEIGRRRELGIDLYDFLKEYGDSANRMPQQNRQIGVGFSFSAEQVECLNVSTITSYRFSGSLRFLMYCTIFASSSESLSYGCEGGY